MNQAFQAIRRQQAPAQRDNSFPALLERSKSEIAKALPRHLNPDRMARIALTAFRTNPKLGECDPMSVLSAVVQASQMGLEIGMMGEAYLVPYKKECQLIPGYAGLMKLARQSGQVSDIYAHEVRENDVFHLRLGMSRELVHEPLQGKGGFPAAIELRGEITGFYAVCSFKDGSSTFVAMSAEDVNRIRDRSNGYKMAKQYGKQSPWDTDYVEMGKKTAIRALAKIMPKSPELSAALAMDAAADGGVTQGISLQQAADGTYEPPMTDPDTGEINESAPQAQHQAAQHPAYQRPATEMRAAAEPVRATARHASATAAPQPDQQRAQSHHARPVSVEDVAPKPTSTSEGGSTVLEKWISQMSSVKSEDDLNEVYIRAEAALQGADRDVIDREYNLIKERLDNGTLF